MASAKEKFETVRENTRPLQRELRKAETKPQTVAQGKLEVAKKNSAFAKETFVINRKEHLAFAKENLRRKKALDLCEGKLRPSGEGSTREPNTREKGISF